MNVHKHTSGPWKVGPQCLSARRFSDKDTLEIQDNRGQMIAVLFKTNRDIDGFEDLANAFVLAAAPELLKVVKRCLAERFDVAARLFGRLKDGIEATEETVVDAANFDFTDDDWREHAEDEFELVQAMRAAIANAEGRS